ncbi:ester cyclase [Streptomyces sp. NPDC023327]|uniref:ester cyclase n=1 Tax=Streptomyces sp. NPDC023327 TaxID=3157088 RepID=UPI0033CCABCC
MAKPEQTEQTTSRGQTTKPDQTAKPERELPELKELAAHIADRVWNHADLGAIDEYFLPHFVGHFPGLPDVYGPADFKKMGADLRKALPDLQERILVQVQERDRVFMQAVLTGTHRGDLMGIPPTGVATVLTEMIILRFEGRKVAELWQQADYMGVMEQLGVVPPRDAGPLGQIAHTFKLMGRFGVLKAKDALRQRSAA